SLDLHFLAKFADLEHNPIINKIGGVTAQLVIPPSPSQNSYLLTPKQVKVEIIKQFPAYETLSQCNFCLTTIGANTAELASLGVPMIVIVLATQIDAMRAWDGIPGILVNLPWVGTLFATVINWLVWQWFKKHKHLYAWPNIWAQEEIVPEFVGIFSPQELANHCLDWLKHPEKLATIRQRLSQVRGEPGAARRIAELVCDQLGCGGLGVGFGEEGEMGKRGDWDI
ncbi:MAG: hypothetical protein F6K24_48710, partial [Okeania sp. SIO2D1]|nr:hypothetical protein [Okeania sp. SIO2D1]